MDFLPKNVHVGRRIDGSKNIVEEYDFDTYSNIQLVNGIAYLFAFGVIAMIASPILLLIFLLQYSGRFHFGFIICVILSGYFVYDCYKGWLLSAFLNIFMEGPVFSFFVKLNLASIGISLYFLILGKITFHTINELTQNVVNRYLLFFGFTFLLGYIVFSFSERYITDDWVNQNIIRSLDSSKNEVVNTESESEENDQNYYLGNYSSGESYYEPEAEYQSSSEIEIYNIGDKLEDGVVIDVDESGNHGTLLITSKQLLDYEAALTFLQGNNLRLPSSSELVNISKNRTLFNELEIQNRAVLFWSATSPIFSEINGGMSKEYYTNFNTIETTEFEVEFAKCINPFTDEIKLIDKRMKCNCLGFREF
jgi:hypothetical protein